MDYRVQIVTAFMNDNLHDRLSTRKLGILVELSESRLRHLFAAQTGVSLQQYLGGLRLDRAKQLLEGTQLTIDEVAIEVGWQDRSHFERRFKRAYGTTPAQYRTAQRLNVIDRVHAAKPQRP